MERGFELVEKKKLNVEGMLPVRATKTSAGYDFYSPVDIVIQPQEKLLLWTDVKVKMKENEVMLLDVRSSIGIKKDLMLANTIGIIDSDYYNNEDTEGNIGICLRNVGERNRLAYYAFAKLPMYITEVIERKDSTEDYQLLTDYTKKDELGAIVKEIDFSIPVIQDLVGVNTVVIKAGERIAQGLFVNYLEAENCNSEEERKGGIGSTTEESK